MSHHGGGVTPVSHFRGQSPPGAVCSPPGEVTSTGENRKAVKERAGDYSCCLLPFLHGPYMYIHMYRWMYVCIYTHSYYLIINFLLKFYFAIFLQH